MKKTNKKTPHLENRPDISEDIQKQIDQLERLKKDKKAHLADVAVNLGEVSRVLKKNAKEAMDEFYG